MDIDYRYYDNEHNDAIKFAIRVRKQMKKIKKYYPNRCVLREKNRTPPVYIIFDIFSENGKIHGILSINDSRFSNREIQERIDTIYYVECYINNYNNYFLIVGVNTIEDILDLLTFLKEVVDYEPNHIDHLDYVRIPPNLMNKWFIPSSLYRLNCNLD